MIRAVSFESPGGPEALHVIDVPLPEPSAGEVRIRHTAIGINFIDVYHRSGLYPLATRPAIPGVEGAGVVAALGPGVSGLKVGDRIAYAGAPVGAYASERLLPVWRAILLPPEVPDAIAGTSMIKGITAHMLLKRTYPVVPGTTILVHAAAGGLGTVLTKWAKRLGAKVIGTVGSEAKAEVAREAGVDELIVGRSADFVSSVLKFTDGRGVDVAYDGIGGATLLKTFAAVRRFGTVASIGQAGGPIPPVDVSELGPMRSLSLARPSVMAYTSEPETYQQAASEVIELLKSGISPAPGRSYSLEEAALAHADLEAGRTTGSIFMTLTRREAN
jgi:NADPH:quinone reductase